MAEKTEETPAARELLGIYLHDHRAGAAAGLQLVRRCRENAGGGELATSLAWLETQIDEDRRSLDSIMEGLDIEQSSLKNALSVAAERVGRLKLNGRLWKRSPLSTLLELEALAAAIFTKRNLWLSLAAVAEQSPVGDAQLLEELIARAEAQLERVQAHHDDAARGVFDAAAGQPAATTQPVSAPATPAADDAAPAPSVPVVTPDVEPVAAVAPGDDLDRVLDDAEGGIEGSLLDAPEDSGPAV